MKDFLRREHVIGVRVSQTEYETMNAFCLQNGLRSIAELARKAIHFYITPEERTVADKVRDQHVKRLEKQIRELRKVIEERTQNMDKGKSLGKTV